MIPVALGDRCYQNSANYQPIDLNEYFWLGHAMPVSCDSQDGQCASDVYGILREVGPREGLHRVLPWRFREETATLDAVDTSS
jgi:hypothetical protein